MAADDMAAEAVGGSQGLFEVEGPGVIKACGFVQALCRNVDGKPIGGGIETGEGHAGAVEGNAVAELGVVEVAPGGGDGEPEAVLGVGAEGRDFSDLAEACDDAGEHRIDAWVRVGGWERWLTPGLKWAGHDAKVVAQWGDAVKLQARALLKVIEGAEV